jgi:signal transduction histidine kinase
MADYRQGGMFSRYREIIIAVITFLVIDVAVLATNFYTSFLIAEDALAINVAGRQRMLSQRMTKELLLLQQRGAVTPGAVEDLASTVTLFDDSLTGFVEGQRITTPAGAEAHLPRTEVPAARDHLKDALAIWEPYKRRLQPVLAGNPTDAELAEAIDYARANNLELLALMNNLTVALDENAQQRATTLRWIQAGGIVLALVNFGYIVLVSLRHLYRRDREVVRAHSEMADMLNTVREGLFLLDRQGRIGAQRSQSLERILQRRAQPGDELIPILQELVPSDTFESARDYIDLLFANRAKEELITSLNPLSEVEVTGTNDRGQSVTRYLTFHFNRILDEHGEVRHLLVTVQDVTQRVELAHQLAEAKDEAKKELDVLVGMLSSSPSELRQFITRVEEGLEQINRMLERTNARPEEYLRVVNQAFRIVHEIKGEAANLDLGLFETQAHIFEDTLNGLRDREELTGDDMLAVSVALSNFYDSLATVQNFIDKVGQFGDSVTEASAANDDAEERPTVETSLPAKLEGIDELAQRVAADTTRRVTTEFQLDELTDVPAATQNELKAMTTQLVRNAVCHGIESPADRAAAGKAEVGTVRVCCQKGDDGVLELSVRDDGAGLRPEAIRESLVANGHLTREQADELSARQLIQRIFEPGFSSAATTSRDAGRGVGMDVVKDKAEQFGGRIGIASKPGEYTEFRIRFTDAALINDTASTQGATDREATGS